MQIELQKVATDMNREYMEVEHRQQGRVWNERRRNKPASLEPKADTQ